MHTSLYLLILCGCFFQDAHLFEKIPSAHYINLENPLTLLINARDMLILVHPVILNLFSIRISSFYSIVIQDSKIDDPFKNLSS